MTYSISEIEPCSTIVITTQAELDALPVESHEYREIEIRSTRYIEISRAYGNSTVTAYGNSTVTASDDSTVYALCDSVNVTLLARSVVHKIAKNAKVSKKSKTCTVIEPERKAPNKSR